MCSRGISVSHYGLLCAVKRQEGIGAEWYSFRRRPWSTLECMCAEQTLVSALSSQSRWKTGHQTQNTLQTPLIKQCLTGE